MESFCAQILRLIELYQSNLSSGEHFRMKPEDILLLINYGSTPNHKDCTCLRRFANVEYVNHLNFLFENVILMTIEMFTCLDKITTNEDQSDFKQYSKPFSTSALDNVDEDLLEYWSSWKVANRVALATLLFTIFGNNLPIYVLLKEHFNLNIGEKMFKTVAFFCENHGIQGLRNVFSSYKLDKFPFQIVVMSTYVFFTIRQWIDISKWKSEINLLKDSVLGFMRDFKDSELNESSQLRLPDFLSWVFTEFGFPEKHPLFDPIVFEFVLRCLSTNSLNIKSIGALFISVMLIVISEQSSQLNSYDHIIGNLTGDWLIENNLVEIMFTQDSHLQLIKHFFPALIFLSSSGRLTVAHVDCIFDSIKLFGKEIYHVLSELHKFSPINLKKHLYSRFMLLDFTLLNEQSVVIAAVILEDIWDDILRPLRDSKDILKMDSKRKSNGRVPIAKKRCSASDSSITTADSTNESVCSSKENYPLNLERKAMMSDDDEIAGKKVDFSPENSRQSLLESPTPCEYESLIQDDSQHEEDNFEELSRSMVESSRQELTELDELFLPENNILWRIQFDSDSTFLEKLAFKHIIKCIVKANIPAITMLYIKGCVEQISSKTQKQTTAYKIIIELVNSLESWMQEAVKRWIEEDLCLIEHFLADLGNFVENESDFSANMDVFADELKIRLHFISKFYYEEKSAGVSDLLKTTWAISSSSKAAREILLDWITTEINIHKKESLFDDDVISLFRNGLRNVGTDKFSTANFSFYCLFCKAVLDRPDNADELLMEVDVLWDIAMTTENNEILEKAIDIISEIHLSYGRGTLEWEPRFIDKIADGLNSEKELFESIDSTCLCETKIGPFSRIERLCNMLDVNLRMFTKRYSHHLRLNSFTRGVDYTSHRPEPKGYLLRLLLKYKLHSEKVSISIKSSDTVAQLRAFIINTCETYVESTSSILTPTIMKTVKDILAERVVEMSTSGHTLEFSDDEKPLSHFQVCNGQTITISAPSRPVEPITGPMDSVPSSLLPAFERENNPLDLLIAQTRFEQIIKFVVFLSKRSKLFECECQHDCNKLAKSLWMLCMFLPTASYFEKTANQLIESSCHSDEQWRELLDVEDIQKMIYSLQVIGIGDQANANVFRKGVVEMGSFSEILCGVLRSDKLNPQSDLFDEWSIECLFYLLELIETLITANFREDIPLGQEFDLTVVLETHKNISSIISDDYSAEFAQKMAEIVHFVSERSYDLISLIKPGNVVSLAFGLMIMVMKKRRAFWDVIKSPPNLKGFVAKIVLTNYENVDWSSYILYVVEDSHTNWIPALLECLTNIMSLILSEVPEQYLDFESTETTYYDRQSCQCVAYFFFFYRVLTDFKNLVVGFDMSLLMEKVLRNLLTLEFTATAYSTEDPRMIYLLGLANDVIPFLSGFPSSIRPSDVSSKLIYLLLQLPSKEVRGVPKCLGKLSRKKAFALLEWLVNTANEVFDGVAQFLIIFQKNELYRSAEWNCTGNLVPLKSRPGYVGIDNLGSTCYLASTLQQLFMTLGLRNAVFSANVPSGNKYFRLFEELREIFVILDESERKSCNIRKFCSEYILDDHPINVYDPKDMTEIFNDLISRMEAMSPTINKYVKKLFYGEISNTIVSLDCSHVSTRPEEFVSIECQVANVNNLYESLDKFTEKDMLEGGNMYTCERCNKKVRAEKRASFKSLPNVLCINTMRYTFNLTTFTREKINSQFSFPMALDMSPYMESKLIPTNLDQNEDTDCMYELTGITVHSGSTETGHYYSFIKESNSEKWFSFNDADVGVFNPDDIPVECFGGHAELSCKDLPPNMRYSMKINNAYMLFYKKMSFTSREAEISGPVSERYEDLVEDIWLDNQVIFRARFMFDNSYFGFITKMCFEMPNLADKPLQLVLLSTCFILDVLTSSVESKFTKEFITKSEELLVNPDVAKRVFKFIVSDDWWMEKHSVHCDIGSIREMFTDFISSVITKCVFKEEDFYIQKNSVNKENPFVVFVNIVIQLLHSMQPNLNEFLLLFHALGEKTYFSTLFLRMNLIPMLVKYYPINYIPAKLELGDSPDEYFQKNAANKANMECILSLILEILESQSTGEYFSRHTLESLAGNEEGSMFLRIQVDFGTDLEKSAKIYSFILKNFPASSEIIKHELLIMTRNPTEMIANVFTFVVILSSNSNAVLFVNQISLVDSLILTNLLDCLTEYPYEVMMWMRDMEHECPELSEYALKNCDYIIMRCLLNESGQIRQIAADFLVELVGHQDFMAGYSNDEISFYDITEKPIPPESMEILHTILTTLLECLVYLQELYSIEENRLFLFFNLLCYFSVSITEKLMFTPYTRILCDLLVSRILTGNRCQNKMVMVSYWEHVCNDCPQNVEEAVSCQSLSRIDCYQLGPINDTVVDYNRKFLPKYFTLLVIFANESTHVAESLTRSASMRELIEKTLKAGCLFSSTLVVISRLICVLAGNSVNSEVENFMLFLMNTVLPLLSHFHNWDAFLMITDSLWTDSFDYNLFLNRCGLESIMEILKNARKNFFVHSSHPNPHCSGLSTVMSFIQNLLFTALDVDFFDDEKDQLSGLLFSFDEGLVDVCCNLLSSYTTKGIRGNVFDILIHLVELYGSEGAQKIAVRMMGFHVDHIEYIEYSGCSPIHGSIPTEKFGMLFRHFLVPTKSAESPVEKAKEFYFPYYDFVANLLRRNATETVDFALVVSVESLGLLYPTFATIWGDLAVNHAGTVQIHDYMIAVLEPENMCLVEDQFMQFVQKYLNLTFTESLVRLLPDYFDNLLGLLNSLLVSLQSDDCSNVIMRRMEAVMLPVDVLFDVIGRRNVWSVCVGENILRELYACMKECLNCEVISEGIRLCLQKNSMLIESFVF